jgi:hypothetical protein
MGIQLRLIFGSCLFILMENYDEGRKQITFIKNVIL